MITNRSRWSAPKNKNLGKSKIYRGLYLVGAIGLEPTTPTMSRAIPTLKASAMPIITMVSVAYLCDGKQHLLLLICRSLVRAQVEGANSKSIEFFNVFSVLEFDIVIWRVFC